MHKPNPLSSPIGHVVMCDIAPHVDAWQVVVAHEAANGVGWIGLVVPALLVLPAKGIERS